MPSVKVRDLVEEYSELRRSLLWATAAQNDLMIWKVEMSSSAYHLITDNRSLDRLKDEAIIESFTQEGFEVSLPPEARSLRTIVLRDVDLIYRAMGEPDIKTIIEESNKWLEIDEVVRLPGAKEGTTPLIKVRLNTIEMARRALHHGILFKHQTLLPKSIEQEVFIKTTLCSNCLSFTHLKRDCPNPDKSVCSKCAGEGHKAYRCNERRAKCANCKEDHVAYYPQCKERKKHIKEKMTSERKRERNRSKSRHQVYLDRENEYIKQGNKKELACALPLNTMTVIMAAIVTASTIAKRKPGTFEGNYNKFCKFNNLPGVAWHPDLIAELIEEDDSSSQMAQDLTGNTHRDEQDLQRKINNYSAQVDKLILPKQACMFNADFLSDLEFSPVDEERYPSVTPSDFEGASRQEFFDGLSADDFVDPEDLNKAIIQQTPKRPRDGEEDDRLEIVPLDKAPKQIREEASNSNKDVCADTINIKDLGISIRYPKQWGTAMNKGVVITEVLEGRLLMVHQTDYRYKDLARLLNERRRNKTLNVNDIEFIPTDAKFIKQVMEEHGMRYDSKNPIYSI